MTRVLLVGHFRDERAEGVRNVARELARSLPLAGVDVVPIDVRDALAKGVRGRYDAIHLVMSPTVAGLLLARGLGLAHPRARLVISAVHPHLPRKWQTRLAGPAIALVQSDHAEATFREANVQTTWIPNGIDLDRFKPVSEGEKAALRDRFGFPEKKRIVLHLASLTRLRNLSALLPLARAEGTALVIVGRPDESYDASLRRELEAEGCILIMEKLARIEDVYRASDIYAFPTTEPTACIEAPLSVLEAMASNLPVVTTRFGALPRMFPGSIGGLTWVDQASAIPSAVHAALQDGRSPATREAIVPYSWHTLAKQIAQAYEGETL